MKLPFLSHSKWPISKEPEERVVNPSHDKQLQDHLMDEVLVALEHKDAARLAEALNALIHSIQNEDLDNVG